MRVYATRMRVVDGFFSVNAARNTLGYRPAGLVHRLPRPWAIRWQRNRVKRQVRESFRKEAGTLPAARPRGWRPQRRAGPRIMRAFAKASRALWTEIRKRCDP